jgi:hypothetical protein
MSKPKPITYQGYHRHPSQDSSAIMEDDGSILVKHRVDLRQGYIITALARLGFQATVAEIVIKLNDTFPNAGYNNNHVLHALLRLRKDYGIVSCKGIMWSLSPNARAKFDSITKKVNKP